ncbi:TlpA family protein disulfide reductase [Actinoplanes sp. NEAU-A11]|uniref:TlpA family protein disulfide reductase n=1 Tax=Actinoplanes aureus TaxID=2792083 RepID=A0A931C7J7_9ACTN|nr:TlpA family protein disulfide reductase [Actinoplanes aureus]
MAAVAAVLVLSACTAAVEPDQPETPSPFAACPAPSGAPDGLTELPDLSLECFTGGQPVELRTLPRPAVINVWASWCAPCREELPVMQGLADRAAGRLSVIGLDSGDRREAAASFATDHDVSFPTLFDPDRRFAGELGQATLPITVFVDTDGKTYIHRSALTVDELIEKVREHTGVTVTR